MQVGKSTDASYLLVGKYIQLYKFDLFMILEEFS